jgi:hypothetical protein
MSTPAPEDYDPVIEIYAYCSENSLVYPFEDYPFSYPSPPLRPSSPPPDLSACFPSPPLLEDTPTFPESETFLANITQPDPARDTYEIRGIHRYRLEYPILPRRAGPDYLRPYGPKSLAQITSFSKVKLSKEDGLSIPSTEEVERIIKKDGKLDVSVKDANYLKEMIHEITKPQVKDIILPKVHPRFTYAGSRR